MSEDYIKMIEKNSKLIFQANAAANIHILSAIKKAPQLRLGNSKSNILENLQHKFITGEAQLELTKDELFELIQILSEIAEPQYLDMYQALADFIQDNIYLFPLEEAEEVLQKLQQMRAKLQVGIKLNTTIEKKQRAAERILGVKQLNEFNLMFNPETDMYSLQDTASGTTLQFKNIFINLLKLGNFMATKLEMTTSCSSSKTL